MQYNCSLPMTQFLLLSSSQSVTAHFFHVTQSTACMHTTHSERDTPAVQGQAAGICIGWFCIRRTNFSGEFYIQKQWYKMYSRAMCVRLLLMLTRCFIRQITACKKVPNLKTTDLRTHVHMSLYNCFWMNNSPLTFVCLT
jgi:hypothetical protein